MFAGQLHNYQASFREPRLVLAGILALLVHSVFIALLVFGFNWKDQPPEGMIVELWQDLSLPVQPQPLVKTVPSPPVQPEQPSKPASEPKPEPTPEPPSVKPAPINVAPPPPKKPDIELKDKSDKPKPVRKELKPDADADAQKKKEQEQAEVERLQREQEMQQKREQEEQKKRELEAQRKREQEEKVRLEARQAAARAQIASEIGKYKALIMAKIRSRIVMPPDLQGNPVTEFDVTLLPGGDILNVRMRKSSGYPAFDSAVERAILLSRPLPLPPDPGLFNEFRNLHVTVHYLE